VSKPNDAIDLTVVYEDAGAGRLTASIPVVPGTISWGRTQAEARGNVVDALGTMLSVGPKTFAATRPRSGCASLSLPHGVRSAIGVSTASSQDPT
jgi:hypothetical protein